MSGLPTRPADGTQAPPEGPEPSERDREFLDFLIRLACEAVAERHLRARAANDNQPKRTT